MCDFNSLSGLVIAKAELVHDYLQISLSNESIFNIYNNYTCDIKPIMALEGRRISQIIKTDPKITIIFDNDKCLEISLLDKDYNGPEAIELRTKEGNIVVW